VKHILSAGSRLVQEQVKRWDEKLALTQQNNYKSF